MKERAGRRCQASSSAGLCPVAGGIVHLDSDYERIFGIGLTIYDADMRVEIATDGANGNRLIGLPSVFGHDAGAVATYVDGGCEFEGWLTKVIKIHKRLDGNTRFLPAQGGRLWQRCSFGPGGPALGRLRRRFLEAMVRRDNGPLGWSVPIRRRWYGSEAPRCGRKPGDPAIPGCCSGFRPASHTLAGRSLRS
jgi:hypothetical protein